MSEQLIGECLCVPLVVDVVGVLAAWSLDGCPGCLARVNDRRVSPTVALGAADGLLEAPERLVRADMGGSDGRADG